MQASSVLKCVPLTVLSCWMPLATVVASKDAKDAILAGLSTKEALVLSVTSTSVRREVLTPLLQEIGLLARDIHRREEAREAGE